MLIRTRKVKSPFGKVLVNIGSSPMFFYIVHLYLLLILYSLGVNFVGANYGDVFRFTHITYVWLVAVVLSVLYFPTKRFSQYKY
ncbi:hypothetical protein [Shewanella sp. 10N.286.54.B9]|uniref:hypothetical protein n=1 Tax=Shewanella sp. 10N.286.54.B9 TaxID=3229719 RepID=UPI003553D3D2